MMPLAVGGATPFLARDFRRLFLQTCALKKKWKEFAVPAQYIRRRRAAISRGHTMVTGHLHPLLWHIRRLAASRTESSATDAELLERFVSRRDEAAFTCLLTRHGPMIWSVCRRIVPDVHCAEDAFQATFLVLLRKAGAIGRREHLANWLYGVAFRVARDARAQAARRQQRERVLLEVPAMELAEATPRHDFSALLDEEVHRLPTQYRTPILLCYYQGKTNAEAAAELGWAEGTVFSRLARARGYLRKRLQRRGLALAAGALTARLAQQASAASLPPGLLQATLHATLSTATAGAATAGAVSPHVAALADGVVKSMLIKKLQTGVALVATTILLAGSALLVHRATGEPPPAAPPAQAAQAPKTSEAGVTEADFKKLRPVLDLKNQAWTTIPWKYSLTEARRLAAKTKKPIFMVVNTGNVMGCA
jgi:RNA polymerase sigma factor (sigma-70 family)